MVNFHDSIPGTTECEWNRVDDVTTVLLTKLDLANDWIENCAAKVI